MTAKKKTTKATTLKETTREVTREMKVGEVTLTLADILNKGELEIYHPSMDKKGYTFRSVEGDFVEAILVDGKEVSADKLKLKLVMPAANDYYF